MNIIIFKTTYIMHSLVKPRLVLPTKRVNVALKARRQRGLQIKAYGDPNPWVAGSAILGSGICTFVTIYCTLNWMHYRELRKRKEEEDKKKK